MREIVFMQIGHCGSRVGEKFWQVVSQEHDIDRSGKFIGKCTVPLQRIDVYYDRGCDGDVYIPRAIFADLEAGAINEIRCGRYGKLFCSSNFITGNKGAANNWARGYHTEGAEIMDAVLDVTRKHVENCECLQGFQIAHSVGGGTGSGVCSLLIKNLREEYGTKIVNTFSVVPSPKVSEVVVEPYNAVLSFKELISYSDETFCLDNEALHDICTAHLRKPCPCLGDLNRLISTAMAGITTSFRFPGQLNADLRKLKTNMVPFPDLHFFIPAVAPLVPDEDRSYCKPMAVSELVLEVFDPRFQMAACDSKTGKYLTAAAIFRGPFSTRDIDEQIARYQERFSDKFVGWIPNNVKTAICNVPPKNMKMAATFIANSTAITFMFQRLLDQFGAMFAKRAFMHWYLGEGMEEQEFLEAQASVERLVKDYSKYENEKDQYEILDDY